LAGMRAMAVVAGHLSKEPHDIKVVIELAA
jgi:hypothetical protein